jgi:hypothetical protein
MQAQQTFSLLQKTLPGLPSLKIDSANTFNAKQAPNEPKLLGNLIPVVNTVPVRTMRPFGDHQDRWDITFATFPSTAVDDELGHGGTPSLSFELDLTFLSFSFSESEYFQIPVLQGLIIFSKSYCQ